MQFKVLSVMQPWAMLIVLGAKKIETRSFDTKYRGPLLIHASANRSGKNYLVAQNEPFKQFLPQYPSDFIMGNPEPIGFSVDWKALSFGAIVGQVNLYETIATPDPFGNMNGNWHNQLSDQEFAFGDYSPDRHGWLLYDPIQFATPLPAKGKLGIWNYDMPDHFHMTLPQGGHATFSAPPGQQTLNAVKTLAEMAYTKCK